jgi:hypothetical protein
MEEHAATNGADAGSTPAGGTKRGSFSGPGRPPLKWETPVRSRLRARPRGSVEERAPPKGERIGSTPIGGTRARMSADAPPPRRSSELHAWVAKRQGTGFQSRQSLVRPQPHVPRLRSSAGRAAAFYAEGRRIEAGRRHPASSVSGSALAARPSPRALSIPIESMNLAPSLGTVARCSLGGRGGNGAAPVSKTGSGHCPAFDSYSLRCGARQVAGTTSAL